MLYNGNEKCTAKENINQIIHNNNLLGDYGIDFKYFNIAENEFSKQTLEGIRNIVSTLFLFETKQKSFDIELLKNEINNLFKNEEDNIALSLLTNYFKNILSGDTIENRYDLLDVIYSNENEAGSMFADLVKQERQKIKEEGKIEGITEGRIESLIKILTKRFGKLNNSILNKLKNITDINKIDDLIDQIFEIKSIDELKI